MRRRNLYPTPTDKISNIDGNPSDWKEFINSPYSILPAGEYAASLRVTETKSKAKVQIWNGTVHEELVDVYNSVVGQLTTPFTNTSEGNVHLALCGCNAEDFSIEPAETYALASGGGLPGFFTASTAPY